MKIEEREENLSWILNKTSKWAKSQISHGSIIRKSKRLIDGLKIFSILSLFGTFVYTPESPECPSLAIQSLAFVLFYVFIYLFIII